MIATTSIVALVALWVAVGLSGAFTVVAGVRAFKPALPPPKVVAARTEELERELGIGDWPAPAVYRRPSDAGNPEVYTVAIPPAAIAPGRTEAEFMADVTTTVHYSDGSGENLTAEARAALGPPDLAGRYTRPKGGKR